MKRTSTNLRDALYGNLSWQAIENMPSSELKIYIEPSDLEPVLKDFLIGKFTPEEIQDWASWILLTEEFCVKNWEDDQIADYYEPMWYVLQQLSTPSLDGEITLLVVEQHLATIAHFR